MRIAVVLAAQLLTFSLHQSIAGDADPGDHLDAIVAPYLDARDFMGVIGIQRDGEPARLRAYGLASIEQSAAHRTSGVFMIGSVSKQFTAAAILLLEEAGALDTADRVEAHLPGLRHGTRITIEQLLTHTAGIADTFRLPSFAETAGLTGDFEAVVRELGEAPLTHQPGASYAYSNGGYVLLAAIVERVSGMSYGDFLRRRLFEPLGMRSTRHGNDAPAEPGRVYGYRPFRRDDLILQCPQAPAYATGPGSLWSSAADLLTWSAALHTGRVLRRRSYRKLVDDYGHGYGFGLSTGTRLDRTVLGHDGRVSGFASDLARYVDDEVSIVVLSNVESVALAQIRGLVAAAYFGEPYRLPERRSFAAGQPDLTGLEGRFSFGPALDVTVVNRDQRLLIRGNFGAFSELLYTGAERWFSRLLYMDVCFHRNDAGVAEAVVWGCGEDSPVGRRVVE